MTTRVRPVFRSGRGQALLLAWKGKFELMTLDLWPCHVYVTFGSQMSTEIIVHFHSGIKYQYVPSLQKSYFLFVHD